MYIDIILINYDENNITTSIEFIKKKLKLITQNSDFINIIQKYDIIKLPSKKKLYTVLKSPHVYKKARNQFELKKYQYVIKLKLNITKENKHLLFFLLNIIKLTNNFVTIKCYK